MELPSILIAAASFVISVVALVLGGRDRRESLRYRQEEQARRVTVNVEERSRQVQPYVSEVQGWTLHVRNDSDRPVHVEMLAFVWSDDWDHLVQLGHFECHQEFLPLPSEHLKPEGEWSIWRDVNDSHRDDGLDAGTPAFAVIEFRDEAGMLWERRSDTGELRRRQRQLRWWQGAIQWSSGHVPGFDALVMHPIQRRVTKSAFRRGPDHVPYSLRVYRWLWGYWGGGEGHPWLRPEGAPALWGFRSLPWLPSDGDATDGAGSPS